MFQVGDYIIKHANGVCKVSNIMHLNIPNADKNRLYYLLTPINDKDAKVYLPADTAYPNIRKIMTKDEALDLIGRIPELKEILIEDEKLRERQYRETLKSGDPEAIVGIIKLLYMRRKERAEQGKKGIAVDEKYFNMAEDNLYSELGFVLQKDKKDICKMIEDEAKKRK